MTENKTKGLSLLSEYMKGCDSLSKKRQTLSVETHRRSPVMVVSFSPFTAAFMCNVLLMELHP